ncbi:MAG: DUF1573 domain-containing protein [Flammeovirgaceae bacterium]|nr:DUF1573 domain-containing protein [Flammeovirgaceae bacterium]
MKRLFFSIGLLVCSIGLFAQKNGKVEFEKTQHAFGKIKEEAGAAEIVFKFKNTGSDPITLTSVKASCGCTTPDWTKEPIQPGKEGFVKASYNPKNRPGKFNKSVTVKTDGQPEIAMLRISGEVIPRPKGPKDFYPMEVGNLRFKSTHIVFGDVMNNGKDTASTLVFNQSEKVINLDVASSKLPSHLKMEAEKAAVAPKEAVRIHFTYDATIKKDWGYNFDYFKLVTDDTDTPEKRINLSATIKENFSELPAGTKMAKVRFDKESHNFGTIQQKTKVATSFTIYNDGEGPLIIRKSKASCGCTASRPAKMELAPGESTHIDVTFNSGNFKGKQKKSVTVICNDPNKPSTTLWIESNIEEAKGE